MNAIMDGSSRLSINKWHIAMLTAALIGIYFLRDFVGVIACAALFAYIFNPVYQKCLHYLKRKKGLAATLTTLFAFVVIGIPSAIIIVLTISQAATLINNTQRNIESGAAPPSVTAVSESLVQRVNKAAEPIIHRDNLLEAQQVIDYVRSILPDIAETLINLITVTITSIPRFVMYAVTFVFVFVGFLMYQKSITEGIRTISPFNHHINDTYFKKVSAMTNAMVKGQFIIALVQGAISAASLSVVGFRPYFFFFLVLFTFLSFIPLGSGIITIPIGIILLITGSIWQGLFVLGIHFIVVTNIDNFLRVKLVPKDAYLPAALTLLAAFAGVLHFGFLGVVFGPIIMILIVTTIQTYIDITRAATDKADKSKV